MPPSSLVLLPRPLPSNTLTLGQLLPNPLAPASSLFNSASSLKPTDLNTAQIQHYYKDLVTLDLEGRLAASLSGHRLDPSQKDVLFIQADEMDYRSLKQPKAALEAICQDPVTQKWIQEMVLRKQSLYFVVGVQELKNAHFKRAIIKDGPLGVSVTEAPVDEAPVDSKARLPIHARRDSSMGVTDTTTSAVFGFEVRKVQCRIGRSDEPHLLEDLDLSWNYHRINATRTEEEQLQLSIGLGKALTQEELRLLAGMMDEDDPSDGSYNSSDSE